MCSVDKNFILRVSFQDCLKGSFKGSFEGFLLRGSLRASF